MRGLAFMAGALCALAATPALAWNAPGHMAVAVIAWDQMLPAAQARATELIKLNPNYSKWTQDASPANRDLIAFARAATWPDEIKSDPAYANDNVDNAPTTDGGFSAPRYKHRYWHYKDLAFSPDGTPTEPPETPNAVTQIAAMSADLTSTTTSDAQKAYALSWIMHLVGDVHQPLHATARYTAAFPRGDGGGNKVKVCRESANTCTDQSSTELHTFWDGAIGTSNSATSAIAKARAMAPASTSSAHEMKVDAWLDESLTIAKVYAYAPPVGTQDKPYRLTSAYQVNAGSYAERRISLAGARLAKLLNAALD